MFDEDRSGTYSPIHKNKQGCDLSVSLLPEDPAVSSNHVCRNNAAESDDGFPTYPTEHRKTVLALCLTTFSTMFCGLVAAFVNDYVPRTPMPDLIFQLFPEQIWAWRVSDTMTMCLLTVNVAVTLLNKHRWIIARRFCMMASQLYLLRGVCMAATWISVPGKYHGSRCMPPADPDRYWWAMFERISRFMMSLGLSAEKGGDHHLCGDLIYSGHTLVLVLCCYNIDLHVPWKRCRWLRRAAAAWTLIGMFMIILCRMHYTVDVVLAFAIATMYFLLYQIAIVRYGGNRDMAWRSYLALIFWYLPFIDYFERNVPNGVAVPRILEWPFGRPLILRHFVKKLNDRNEY